jgi:hypothetical protein
MPMLMYLYQRRFSYKLADFFLEISEWVRNDLDGVPM